MKTYTTEELNYLPQCITTEDVFLIPGWGNYRSRNDIDLYPYLINAPMDCFGVEFLDALLKTGQQVTVPRYSLDPDTKDFILTNKMNDRMYLAVGNDPNQIKTLKEILGNKFQCGFIIDIAHGASVTGGDIYDQIMETFDSPGDIVSGSIATGSQLLELQESCPFINGFRVGIGPGAACITRSMTGIGIPQLSAVIDCVISSRKGRKDTFVIADGGVNSPSDAIKYIAAGASMVMMGKVFARSDEALGFYRGQASSEFQLVHKGEANRCPEGVSFGAINKEHPVKQIVDLYMGGAASACSYVGAYSLRELPDYANWVLVSPTTAKETHVQTISSSR